jgi:hypothetical protein
MADVWLGVPQMNKQHRPLTNNRKRLETTSKDGYQCLGALKILTEKATLYLPFTNLSHVNQLVTSFDPSKVESQSPICRPVATT